ncbi:Ff.00g007080.m01.CDS01 [Fusarium sp. VM40]|nr:Ff.00g007080.m01.CDS01 [Fusarium sp. VM40]
MNSEDIYAKVSERYGTTAKGSDAKYSNTVAKAFGYSEEELASIPKDANLGLSCGTPLATATLREGEVVIDLGSGAGLDVFLAAKKVGPSGKAIGDMLSKAMALKADYGMNNVEFVESRITNIALEGTIADCIISNCVINLVPHDEKQQVFNEIFRLLKPGGRVAISDILAKKPVSDNIKNSMALYVGCIAGASQVFEYEQYMRNAGFEDPLVADTGSDLNVYLDDSAGGCCSATNTMALDLKGEDLNEWFGLTSIRSLIHPELKEQSNQNLIANTPSLLSLSPESIQTLITTATMVSLSYVIYALSAIAGVQACKRTCTATGDSGTTCSYSCSQVCSSISANLARNTFLAALQNGGNSCSAVGTSGVQCRKTSKFGSCYDHYWSCGSGC